MQELLRLRRLQYNPDTRSAQLLRLRRLQRLRLQVIHTAKAYTPDGGKAQRLCRFFARREIRDLRRRDRRLGGVDKALPRCYHRDMKKYNFLTWWLDLSPKPLPYRIWKMIVTPAMFIAWVTFVAVYPDMYWNFCLCAVLPVGVVDTVWEVFNFRAYRKKCDAAARDGADGASAE